ncbi:MAG: hypothetical protein N2645_14060 [Clostridia bacterium]|nr:hypothetical protein [Clostridia bacterium]
MGYPLQKIYEEVAYIAYHFHWPHEEILKLEHRERVQWVDEIGRINKRINKGNNNTNRAVDIRELF